MIVPPPQAQDGVGDTAATRAPVRMAPEEKMRLRAAAFRVTRVYPGPVGELVSRELLTWEEFGYRLGGEQLIYRLVDHIMAAEPRIEK